MLWGVTLRSPHPHARIRSLDIGPALAVPGVFAVLTADDVPGELRYGLEFADQPVLAKDVVLYQGEPVALVAADHPETARRAASRIVVEYDALEPVTDARVALGHGEQGPAETLHPEPTPVMELSREAAVLRPHGNLIRHLKVRKGDVEAARAAGTRRRLRRVRGRHAGPGLPRSRVRARGAGGGRWRRPLRLHPVAARRPAAGLPGARAAAREGAAHAGRRRGRLRRPRGPVDARPRLHARDAHRQAGEDVLQPRGVLLRARAPAPSAAALRPRVRRGRPAALRAGKDLAGRRRLRVVLGRSGRQRGPDGHRPLRRAARPDGLLGGVHQQPAVRRDARLRRGPGRVRLRVADGQGRRRAGHGPRRGAGAQRDGGGLGRADRPGRRQCRAGGRAAAPAAGDADAGARTRRPARRTGWGLQHHPRRGRAPRRRVGGGLQEHRLQRGLRRLLDRAGAARGGRRRADRHRAHRGRRGRAGPGDGAAADRAHRARRRPGRRRPGRHGRGVRRLDVGVAADLRDGRCGAGGLPSGARAPSCSVPAATTGTAGRPCSPTWRRCSATTRSRRR